MSRAVISIGSNQGDAMANLRVAVAEFAEFLVAASPVVQTPPWGPVEQHDYLNAILIVQHDRLGARDWLERGWAAERAAGRERLVRWGPRTLDVDIVSVFQDGAEIASDEPELTLPHPHSAGRAFVLVPWLAADAQARTGGHPVAELIEKLPAEDVAAVRWRPDLGALWP